MEDGILTGDTPPDDGRLATGRNAQGVAGSRTLQISQAGRPERKHIMQSIEWFIAYGKRIGVRYHIYNSRGCLVGGTKTLEQAQAMKRRYEIEERDNPFTGGKTRFEIREAK